MAGLPAAIRRAGLGQDRPLEKHKVPAMYPFSAFAFEGGLSYGVGRGCFVGYQTENSSRLDEEILAAMAKHGISGSRSALQRFFDRNVALKKTCTRQNKNEPMSLAPADWIREQGMLDAARLVFIDETAISTNMVRLSVGSESDEWRQADGMR